VHGFITYDGRLFARFGLAPTVDATLSSGTTLADGPWAE
jgi:hypothetical protein